MGVALPITINRPNLNIKDEESLANDQVEFHEALVFENRVNCDSVGMVQIDPIIASLPSLDPTK